MRHRVLVSPLSSSSIAALVATVVLLAPGAAPAAQSSGKQYVMGGAVLEVTLDGKRMAASVKKVSGGTAVGTVDAKPPTGAKGIVGVRYDPIVATVRPGDLQDLLPALKARRAFDGALYLLDFDRKPKTVRRFTGALLTRISLSDLDATAGKDTVRLDLEITPAAVTTVKPEENPVPAVPPADQKKFPEGNFKVTIDGVDTSRVNKVGGISIGYKTDDRPGAPKAATISASDLKVTVAESHAQTWIDWHEDFVVKGNCGPEKERKLRIDLLSPDMKTVLFSVEGRGVGIFALRPDAFASNSEQIARLEAELYVQDLIFPGGAAGAAEGAGKAPPLPVPPPARLDRGIRPSRG